MAIEPLGSMTTTNTKVKTTAETQAIDNSVRTGNTDVTASNNVTIFNGATSTITKTNKSDTNQNVQGNNLPTNETVKNTINNFNKNICNTEAVFGIHDGTNRVTIKIIDKKTKEVIKEFPPEKTLDMIEKVWEMAGIMVDEKR